jgi:hypothetical protein
MLASLVRLNSSAEHATLGAFRVYGSPIFLTLELPDRNNEKNKSRIPAGDYVCRRVRDRVTVGGMHIAETFEVCDVPGRTGVLFHIGNSMKDTQGCILPGRCITGPNFLTDSAIAFELLLKTLEGVDEFRLSIVEVP